MTLLFRDCRDFKNRERRPNTERKDWGENAVAAKHGKKSRRDGKYLFSLISFHFLLMSSLKAARNHLLISHFEEVINDEEFLLLYDINKSSNPDLPYDLYEFFDFGVLEEDECLSEFRFRREDIPFLAEVIQILDEITFTKEVFALFWRKIGRLK